MRTRSLGGRQRVLRQAQAPVEEQRASTTHRALSISRRGMEGRLGRIHGDQETEIWR